MTDERLRELYQHTVAARARAGAARERCPAPEALLALARREGAEGERLATLDHAMACDACQGELGLLRAIEAAGRGRTPARWRLPLPLAVAASALLAVGVGVSAARRGGEDGPRAEVVRGGEGTPVALVHPAASAAVAPGAPIDFTWRAVPGARRYQLELIDAAGRPALAASTSDTVATLRDTERLVPGAEYRWWVRVADAPGGQAASPLRPLRVRGR